jgi:hypothetical protein
MLFVLGCLKACFWIGTTRLEPPTPPRPFPNTRTLQAFRQAGDLVRAEVAAARQLRLVAAGAAYQDNSVSVRALTADDKRRMLLDVAFRCLYAARRAEDAPVRVTAREAARWVRLAAQCLLEAGQLQLAAQLHSLTHGYKVARELLTRQGAHSLLAVTCARATSYYTALARAHEVCL